MTSEHQVLQLIIRLAQDFCAKLFLLLCPGLQSSVTVTMSSCTWCHLCTRMVVIHPGSRHNANIIILHFSLNQAANCVRYHYIRTREKLLIIFIESLISNEAYRKTFWEILESVPNTEYIDQMSH